MALTNEQITELKKYQKMLSQLEKILSVSSLDDQKKRVSKDIQKYKNKILSISPSGIPDAIQSFSKSEVKVSKNDESESDEDSLVNPSQVVFDNLVVMRMCPHSTDQEINFLSTLINLFEVEYIPVLSDAHIKFDFSHVNERNNIVKQFENIKRTMKVLIETIEEYASSDKQEFKEQMGRMKNKQSRVFISEASELFKKIKIFVDGILKNLASGENIITNHNDIIRFNPKTEPGTILAGKKVSDALKCITGFLEIALENIAVPK